MIFLDIKNKMSKNLGNLKGSSFFYLKKNNIVLYGVLVLLTKENPNLH